MLEAYFFCPPAMDDATLLREELQTHMHQLLASIERSVTGLAPGARRLLVGVEAFWEASYRRRDAVIKILRLAEAVEARERLARNGHILERMLATELRACGLDRAEELAPDLAAEIGAVVRAERFAGQRLPALRRRLIGFIESRTGLPSLWSAVAA